MIEIIPRPWKQLINRVKLHTKQWTRPTTCAIVAGSLSDLQTADGLVEIGRWAENPHNGRSVHTPPSPFWSLTCSVAF
jgi:hypothetical protein